MIGSSLPGILNQSYPSCNIDAFIMTRGGVRSLRVHIGKKVGEIKQVGGEILVDMAGKNVDAADKWKICAR